MDFDTVRVSYDTSLNISNERYTELVLKETQLEFVKKLLASKISYNNYADISDLLLLLDVKKEETKDE